MEVYGTEGTSLVNIFDKDAFRQEIEKLEGVGSKADTIAYRTKKTIEERMDEDPAFFRKFSELLVEAIRAFREKRLADRDYLNKVMEIAESVQTRSGENLPEIVRHNDIAIAFYGAIQEALSAHADAGDLKTIGADAALRIDEIIRRLKIVNWTSNADVQNGMKNEIEDYLHELKEETGLALTFEEMDQVLEKCLDIARRRYPG